MAAEALTLGKYHYWDDYEDDCTKRFHYFTGSDGKDHHIDFSPYHRPTKDELEAVREFTEITGYVPHSGWNNNFNFNDGFYKTGVPDIIRIVRELKDGLCCCGDPDCNEQYEHWTGGY